MNIRRYMKVLLIAIMILFAAASAVYAQANALSERDIEQLVEKLRSGLDDYSLELADEYLDILEQLQEVVEDYSDYLADLEPEDPQASKIDFSLFTEGLKRGKYAQDHNALRADMEDFLDDLKSLEREQHGGVGRTDDQRSRIVRNLRREINILLDLVEDYTETAEARRTWDSGDMEVYLKEAMKKLTAALKENKVKFRDEIFDKLEGLEEYDPDFVWLPYILDIPDEPEELDIPDIPDIPDVPDVPEVRVYKHPKAPKHSFHDGLATETRTYSASMRTSGDIKQPVVIVNPLGDAHITGWNENAIVATLDIEVAAGSSRHAEEFVSSISLEAGTTRGSYVIKADLPDMDDPDMKIISSVLVASVPSDNPVECENSYGEITAKNLKNGFRGEGKYSEIRVEDIRGDVFVRNSMGTIALDRIKGDIKAINGYGPIAISESQGDIEIENAYSEVLLSHCTGDASLKNSGKVTVNEHDGEIEIDNMYGTVEITDVSGNLQAVNAYQPLIISHIDGSADLQNAYAKINVKEIQGELLVSNTFGSIWGEELTGPLKVKTDNGNVRLILGQRLRGSSTITASYGTVDVTVDESSNLFLYARTTNGKIRSLLPLEISDEGMTKIGQYRVGRGNDSLSILGDNVAIIIGNSP